MPSARPPKHPDPLAKRAKQCTVCGGPMSPTSRGSHHPDCTTLKYEKLVGGKRL